MNSPARADQTDQRTETEISVPIPSVLFTRTEPALHPSEIILLVEDEAFVRNVMAEVLASAGYNVTIAGNAAEALAACGQCSERVDLLLADIVMPGMNGRELAAQFVKLYPQAPVLLMTGYTEQLARSQPSLCDYNCLAKPFSIWTLLRTIRDLLATRHADFRARA